MKQLYVCILPLITVSGDTALPSKGGTGRQFVLQKERETRMSLDQSQPPLDIKIQVVPLPVGGASPQALLSSLKTLSPDQLAAIGNLVDQVQRWLIAKLDQAAPRPSGVSLEFGVDVAGEGGVPFITKGSIGANFKVKMEWK